MANDSKKDEKAKLYRLIARANRHVVLERMRVTGFWPSGMGLPEDPKVEADERRQLEDELAKLRARHGVVKDPEKALREERIRRWEASKKRRAAGKELKAAAQAKRRAEWIAKRAATIVHAGAGVSGGLEQTTSDTAKLIARGLPVLDRAEDLASALGITLGRLRWLTFHRRAATRVHYHRFEIPKKTGGVRRISAPKKALAGAQRWILEQLVDKVPVGVYAHGFVRGRSILTNATPHVGRAIVINLDLKDFFPSITFRRVKGVFKALGYSEHIATLLGLLCTEPPRAAAELDGKVFHVALGERMLPQGACTSPAITNLLCRRLDLRLAGLARRYGMAYTRYADDLTFSAPSLGNPEGGVPKPLQGSSAGRPNGDFQLAPLLRRVRLVLASEGLTENKDKTRIMRRGARQEVTGLTVNDKLAPARADTRELRAILHNAARHGLASQNRGGHPDFAAHLRGRVEYLCMVDPSRATAWRAALARALGAA